MTVVTGLDMLNGQIHIQSKINQICISELGFGYVWQGGMEEVKINWICISELGVGYVWEGGLEEAKMILKWMIVVVRY